MRTLTLGQVRAVISRVEGVCATSDRVASLVNEAQERLLNRGDYPVNSLVLYRACVGQSSCISWPRAIRTVEAYAICNTPGQIRGPLSEFIGYPNGTGLLDGQSYSGRILVDRGTACTFDNVQSSSTAPRKIGVIADNVADVGRKITIRYIDSNLQKVYSSIGGVVQEGEQLTLIAPPGVVYTSRNVASGSPYHIVKEITKYPIYLYEVDGGTLVQTKLLSQYEPSEEVPIYRRSFIPGLTDAGGCDGATDNCTGNKTLTALVKLQHVPVIVDNDPLVIGNLAALKLMVMAILREEQNRHEEAAILEAKARAEIDGELSSYTGDGQVSFLKVASDFGAGVPSLAGYYYW